MAISMIVWKRIARYNRPPEASASYLHNNFSSVATTNPKEETALPYRQCTCSRTSFASPLPTPSIYRQCEFFLLQTIFIQEPINPSTKTFISCPPSPAAGASDCMLPDLVFFWGDGIMGGRSLVNPLFQKKL